MGVKRKRGSRTSSHGGKGRSVHGQLDSAQPFNDNGSTRNRPPSTMKQKQRRWIKAGLNALKAPTAPQSKYEDEFLEEAIRAPKLSLRNFA